LGFGGRELELRARRLWLNAESRPQPQFPTLRIGPIELDFPVVQAALSGYSDWAMRVIARRLGAPYTLCEVLLDRFVTEVSRGRRARRYMQVSDEEHPVGAQLMGANPLEFGPAARHLVAAGFDVVDINFGCPVKKVLGRCRGGFLLSQVDTALEIVSRVREAVPPEIPVTVKMRRGIDDTAESRDKFFRIFDGAYERGVAAITVHGRTVEQKYVGPSHWEFLREVKQHAGTRTVLGSGDLFTPRACIEMLEQTRVDGVTAARGAIGNPWIFNQARALAAGLPLPAPPSLFEQRAVIAEHYRLAEELYGPVHCGRQMRKFGIKYSQLHPHSRQVRDAFVAVSRPGQWKGVLDQWYAEDLPGRHPAPNGGDLQDCQEPASAA
jgi:tRNA-dihydrouridine synthase B